MFTIIPHFFKHFIITLIIIIVTPFIRAGMITITTFRSIPIIAKDGLATIAVHTIIRPIDANATILQL